MRMRESDLDWKSGALPENGYYLMKGKNDGNEEAIFGRQLGGLAAIRDLWIGPLDLPEKAPEPPAPPAPDWGWGPVPTRGRYMIQPGTNNEWHLRTLSEGDEPSRGDWYGPIPDRPSPAEEPAEPNEWANLAKYKRCTYQPYVARCVFQDGHHGACRFANGDLASGLAGGRA